MVHWGCSRGDSWSSSCCHSNCAQSFKANGGCVPKMGASFFVAEAGHPFGVGTKASQMEHGPAKEDMPIAPKDDRVR